MEKEMHTPTPWEIEDGHYAKRIVGADKSYVADIMRSGEFFTEREIENRRRIIACVNKCEGIPTYVLDGLTLNFLEHAAELERLKAQNARLLEALKYSLEAVEAMASFGKSKPVIARIKAAIAEAEK